MPGKPATAAARVAPAGGGGSAGEVAAGVFPPDMSMPAIGPAVLGLALPHPASAAAIATAATAADAVLRLPAPCTTEHPDLSPERTGREGSGSTGTVPCLTGPARRAPAPPASGRPPDQ